MATPIVFAQRWLLLLVLGLALGGCSAVKIAYNQADHVLAWMADDYFDLGTEQKEALRIRLSRFHAWHRATQLDDYAALLDSAEQRLRSGPGAEDADWVIEAVRARYRAIVQHAYLDAARLLSTLSDDQVEGARRQFDKNNRKFARDNGVGAPAQEQRRLRARRHVERIEHWSGPLNPAQAAKVRELSHALPLIAELRYQDRLRRQREFLALLQNRRDGDALAPKLRDWLIGWERNRPSAEAEQFARFLQASNRMYIDILRLLGADQRQHVAAKLQDYRQALRELATEIPARHFAAEP
ncbi:MAG: hypothetical protein IT531_20705 [Burkholderiales bacterium]|nr:hypothetical protein [Burkholderiales bacterium]